MNSMATAFVGIGANMADPISSFRSAMSMLDTVAGVSVTAVSSLYKTRPVGYENQSDFTNAVAAVQTTLAPLALLDRLLEIETQLGRTRDGVRFGPRIIDLDLLLYDDQQIQSVRLTLPHPRMHQRRFVLEPLAEVAPKTTVPGRGAVTCLLSELESDGVELLQNDWYNAASSVAASVAAAEPTDGRRSIPAETD